MTSIYVIRTYRSRRPMSTGLTKKGAAPGGSGTARFSALDRRQCSLALQRHPLQVARLLGLQLGDPAACLGLALLLDLGRDDLASRVWLGAPQEAGDLQLTVAELRLDSRDRI